MSRPKQMEKWSKEERERENYHQEECDNEFNQFIHALCNR